MRRYRGLIFRIILLSGIFHVLLSSEIVMADEHDHHDHHDHSNEIGIAGGYVMMEPEDDAAFGMHLHYMRHLPGEGFQRYLGLGLGAEAIFADHMHYAVMGTLGIYPYRDLVVGISPGILIVEHEDDIETRYATHIEAAYGFMVGEIHIGPVIGFAQSGDDRHFMVGVHLGKGF